MSPTITAHIALFLVSSFYAINYFIIKHVFEDVSPFALVLIRVWSGLLFFGVIGLFIREKVARKDLLILIGCGITGVGINQLFFVWGMSYTHEVHGAVIMTLSPIFVFLISLFIGRENLSTLKVIGLLSSFGGAALLSLGGRTLQFDRTTLIGDLMIVVNAFSYAVYLVLAKPISQKYNPYTISRWLFMVGAVIATPIGLGDLLAINWSSVSPVAIWSVIYVVIFITILAYAMISWAIQWVPSFQVGIYIYLQPVIVVLLTPLLSDRGLNLEQLLYIVMVIAGVYIVTFKRRPKQVAQQILDTP